MKETWSCVQNRSEENKSGKGQREKYIKESTVDNESNRPQWNQGTRGKRKRIGVGIDLKYGIRNKRCENREIIKDISKIAGPSARSRNIWQKPFLHEQKNENLIK